MQKYKPRLQKELEAKLAQKMRELKVVMNEWDRVTLGKEFRAPEADQVQMQATKK